MAGVTVRAPASTANLGPAFDCLGLALDLWNETSFEIKGSALSIEISGEGEQRLPRNERNLIFRAFKRVYDEVSQPVPNGLRIRCKQRIPLSSGLGSSAAACLAGLLGANALLGEPLKIEMILQLGAELEGHADNLAAALFGGLVLVTHPDWRFAARKLECAPLHAVYVLPESRLSTRESRKALPAQVSLSDAVFNIGQSLAAAEALRSGDLAALAIAMEDKLHQSYRLPLIPGAAEALAAAKQAGAAAALSGAGPGVIAFAEADRLQAATDAMQAPFAERGVKTREFALNTTERGAEVTS